MKVIEKILELFKNDKDYFVEFKINNLGFTIYLDNDPECTFEQKYIIPITYDLLYEMAHIPDDEFREKMQKNDIGITFEEVQLIEKIMKLMIKYKNEIKVICNTCDIERRGKKYDD